MSKRAAPRTTKIVVSVLELIRRAGLLLIYGVASVIARLTEYVLSEVLA